ncbi:MAG: glycine/sarcosine/betaine reductase complex component C subunit alpha [Tissierellia bacterium]|nr:glycine/sarcosine/betaine reductase complex component C subunit alpha [Tissierellia bacterium]
MSNKIIADTLLEIADAIESGEFGKKPTIAVTNIGCEHGIENIAKACELAQSPQYNVVMIGKACDNYKHIKTIEVDGEDEMYEKMEQMLDQGEIDACITMHYNFPIGVSTVGRVVTPSTGKEMFIATTTGTSATHRVEAMIRNTISGIVAAKSTGIKEPTVGILNIEGARQVEKGLRQLNENGYPIHFAESKRSDGGVAMRGNDLLMGTPDVMVTDSLTGNLLMKIFSSYTTGGAYEAMGFGYGPGIGENFKRRVFIVSRASGAPVIANAIRYAYDTVKDQDIVAISEQEFKKAHQAKLDQILGELTAKKDEGPKEEVKMPEKEVVSEAISGIDILEIEDATRALWKEGIYAESGMGCTGPIVQVNSDNLAKARQILRDQKYIMED